jgi:PAS domain S-box-containing protein
MFIFNPFNKKTDYSSISIFLHGSILSMPPFKDSRERNRIIIVAILLCIACLAIFYSHNVLRTGAVFTHLFYIPIVLSSIWWQRKGIIVAIWLSIVLIMSHLFLRFNVEIVNDFLRASMFILISIIVAVLGERIKMRESALQESEARFRTVVENAMMGFSIIQNEKVLYQNPEQENLLGPLPRSPKLNDLENIHPDDVEKVKAFYENISSEDFERSDTDFRFYSKRGRRKEDRDHFIFRKQPYMYEDF